MQRSTSLIFALAVLLCCLAVAGCTPKTTVVLVSDPQGEVGEITVSNDAGTVTMDKERQSTSVRGQGQGPADTGILSKEEVDRRFREALAIQPRQPLHFVLYFKSDSIELAAESRAILPEILQSIKDRDSQDISSIGHTDTAGDLSYNLQLSQQRAEAVARLLEAAGVARGNIEVTSHGEKNPVIRTGDNVSEPRNRRVEVVIR
jgi:outer membrane protein OmpA-like peptidoglycan-associated protein